MKESKIFCFKRFNHSLLISLLTLMSIGIMSACTPAVKVEAPEKPIDINLNVKIQHEILIKVDKQLDDMFSESSGLF